MFAAEGACLSLAERRQAFVEQLQNVLAGAQRDQHLLVYLDEAHIHQDADLGYGWAAARPSGSGWPPARRVSRPRSRSTASTSTTKAQVRLWPYPRANGEHTIDVLRRLRAEHPDRALIVLWDGAPYHRAGAVREAAADAEHRADAAAGLQP